MARIFVSYRRDDPDPETRLLIERLQKSLPSSLNLLGVGSLESPEGISQDVEQLIAVSDAVIAIIGPGWLQSNRESLSNTHNLPREIERALERGVPIIPVLVAGATMPAPDDLPTSISRLALIQAARFRSERAESDIRYLISRLTAAVGPDDARSIQSRDRLMAPSFGILDIIGIAFAWTFVLLMALMLLTGAFAVIQKVVAVTPIIVHFAQDQIHDSLQDERSRSALLIVAASLAIAASVALVLYFCRQSLIAAVFTWFANRYYIGLGPGWGHVDGPLNAAMLQAALPESTPPGSTISQEQMRSSNDTAEFTELQFKRAAEWSSHLSTVIRDEPRLRSFRENEITTIGFISFKGGHLRLGVIYYLSPLQALKVVIKRELPHSIEVSGERFLVLVRPWLPVRHGAARPSGNCWVKCRKEGLSMLTALHAVSPKKLGKPVKIEVSRSPQRGHLLRASEKMDAAMVSLAVGAWGGKKIAPPSAVIGYKPIQLLSSKGPTDGQVLEIPGNTIWGQRGQEPLNGNMLFFNPSLQPGDSGCLVLDREHKNAPPYLMYLGKTRLGNGQSYGFGVLLEQVRLIWDLEFYL